jgi:hypothetical protein
LEAGGDMAEHSEVWNLHLVYHLSHIPQGFDEDVLRKVRAIAGVTSVAVVPSYDAATHLAFSTRYSNAVVAAVEAKQCLQDTTWKVMSQISDALKNSPFEIKGL